jgi:leader peptidase (prepilin peptidase)/N-methyltransferase
MGMGDVKLMAPIGLFLGWKLCLTALFIGVVSAGLVSLFLILTKLRKGKDTIPFGPFLVAGAFITVLWGWDLLNWYLGRL